jgi:hypothetical protein
MTIGLPLVLSRKFAQSARTVCLSEMAVAWFVPAGAVSVTTALRDLPMGIVQFTHFVAEISS